MRCIDFGCESRCNAVMKECIRGFCFTTERVLCMANHKRHSERQKQLAKRYRKRRGRGHPKRAGWQRGGLPPHKPFEPNGACFESPSSAAKGEAQKPEMEAVRAFLTEPVRETNPFFSAPYEERPVNKTRIENLRVIGAKLHGRIVNALHDADYIWAEDLESLSDEELAAIRGIGPAAIRDIRTALVGLK